MSFPDLQGYLPTSKTVQGEGVNDVIALKKFEVKLVESLKDLPTGYIPMWRNVPEFFSCREFASSMPNFKIRGRWVPVVRGAMIPRDWLYVTPHFPYWSHHGD